MQLVPGQLPAVSGRTSTRGQAIVPPDRDRYLAEIAATVRDYHRHTDADVAAARRRQQLNDVAKLLRTGGHIDAATKVEALAAEEDQHGELSAASRELLDAWPARVAEYRDAQLTRVSLSGTPVPRVAVPRYADDGELLRWLRSENLPGEFPYTAGVFPFKREGEDPARMFAGEGRRLPDQPALPPAGRPASPPPGCRPPSTRSPSTASTRTVRPDIYGKVGNSGVSIATLDDMKALYGGFDLCDPSTSVSMTINGPAPTILAMFLNTAIDDQLSRAESEKGAALTPAEVTEAALARCARSGARCRPTS